MATAKKLPSGNWRVQVYAGKVDGRPRYKSFTASTRKEAELMALEYQTHKRAVESDTAALTLSEAMAAYIDGRRGVLSVTTVRGYETIARNWFGPLMGVQLRRLTPAAVQQSISAEAQTHSPKSVENAYSLLRAALRQYHKALAQELEASPPKLPQARKFQPTVLDVEQVGVLVRAVRGDVMEVPVLLALWCCLRESEICGLRWTDIQGDRLHVHRARVLTGRRGTTEKGPKTLESDRWINLDPYLVDRLRAAQEASDGEFVTRLSGSSMLDRLQTILRRNGLPKIRFHDLRHSNASIMALTGVPQYLAQRRGGWSTPSTMQRVYTHTMEAGGSVADEKVNAFFRGLLGISHEKSHDEEPD